LVIRTGRPNIIQIERTNSRAVLVLLLASNTSIKTALEPVKLVESIGKGCRDLGSCVAVQPVRLDEPSASGHVPEGSSKVSSGLSVVVGALPTSSITSRHAQPSESDVIHDHRLTSTASP
jgi:hypothetical protein